MPDRDREEFGDRTPRPQPLDAYEYDEGDVFQGMGGDYWVITARLWNFDAKEIERTEPGEAYEVTRDHHRREYELSKADPGSMGADKQRLCEIDIDQYMDPSTADEAREYYRKQQQPEEP